MSAPSAFRYSTSTCASFASFVRSARLPLVRVHRTASPSRLSRLTFTPRVNPKNCPSVSSAAALSAMALLACRWSLPFASRSACCASAKRTFGTLLSSAVRASSSPALYSCTGTPASFSCCTSASLALSGSIAARTSSKPTARCGFASKYPVGIFATSLYSARILCAASLLIT